MTQGDLDCLSELYSFLPGIQARLPKEGETILSTRMDEVAFYEVAFHVGLWLPIHPTIRRILNFYNICPAQLSPNMWQSVVCMLVVWRYYNPEDKPIDGTTVVVGDEGEFHHSRDEHTWDDHSRNDSVEYI